MAYHKPTEVSNGLKTPSGSRSLGASAFGSYRQSKPTKVPCGTVWPNGEFGLGYASNTEERLPSQVTLAGGVSVERMREECETIAEGDGAQPLDLTSLPNSHKASNRPETYGRKGLSGYGGKMIRNAGHVLEERYGRRNLTFLTLTLPAMSRQAARAVAESWGDTVRQLVQWLARRLEKAALSTSVALVTELQPVRLKKGDCSVLHIHCVFVGRRRGGSWVLSPKEVRSWWCRRLSRVTGGEVESPNCCDMKQVKRSAGNYLSKYMSKGSDDIELFAERMGWDCVPRQWWNMSKAMRGMVKSACLTSPQIMLVVDALVHQHYFMEPHQYFKFCRVIEVKATELQSFVVGYWGRLTNDAVADLLDMSKAIG